MYEAGFNLVEKGRTVIIQYSLTDGGDQSCLPTDLYDCVADYESGVSSGNSHLLKKDRKLRANGSSLFSFTINFIPILTQSVSKPDS